MQSFMLMLVVGATLAGVSSGCKYFCRNPETGQYICCDDGNPFTEAPETEAPAITESHVSVEPVAVSGAVTYPPSHCYYYCSYDGKVYCCGDDSQTIPPNHDAHDGRCPEEDEQVCKKYGVFSRTNRRGKTTGAIELVRGNPRNLNVCASDGYCNEDQKCCPSPCAKKHICMASLEEDKKEN